MELKTVIRAEHITFGYTAKMVLNDVNLSIRTGEIVTVLGPNGSGKSTLLKTLLGIYRPLRGGVFFDGMNISRIGSKALARQIAYVPQVHKGSFPYRVIDVALLGRIPHKTFFFKYSKHDMDVAYDALERLSIPHLAERPYTEISGGERQLTLIARALSQGARTFIMDEPASGLDYGNQLRLLERISALSHEGYTFIKSTHSPEHALWIADRAVMMKDGRIVADGRCDDVVNEASLFDLYNAEVSVVRLNGLPGMCVPQKICGCMRPDKASGRVRDLSESFIDRDAWMS